MSKNTEYPILKYVVSPLIIFGIVAMICKTALKISDDFKVASSEVSEAMVIAASKLEISTKIAAESSALMVQQIQTASVSIENAMFNSASSARANARAAEIYAEIRSQAAKDEGQTREADEFEKLFMQLTTP